MSSTIASNNNNSKCNSVDRLLNDHVANNCRPINQTQINRTQIQHKQINRSKETTNKQLHRNLALDKFGHLLKQTRCKDDDTVNKSISQDKRSHLHHLYELRKLHQQQKARLHDQLEEQSDASYNAQQHHTQDNCSISNNNSDTNSNSNNNDNNSNITDATKNVSASLHDNNNNNSNSRQVICDRINNGATHSNSCTNKQTTSNEQQQLLFVSGLHQAPLPTPPPPPPPLPPFAWRATAQANSSSFPPPPQAAIGSELASSFASIDGSNLNHSKAKTTKASEAMPASSRSSFARHDSSAAPSVHSSSVQQQIVGQQRPLNSRQQQLNQYHSAQTNHNNHNSHNSRGSHTSHINQEFTQQLMAANLAKGQPHQFDPLHRDNLFGHQHHSHHSHHLHHPHQPAYPRDNNNSKIPLIDSAQQQNYTQTRHSPNNGRHNIVQSAANQAAPPHAFGGELVPACRTMQHAHSHLHHFHNHHNHNVYNQHNQCKHRSNPGRPQLNQQHTIHSTGCCRAASGDASQQQSSSDRPINCSKSDNQSDISAGASCLHRRYNMRMNQHHQAASTVGLAIRQQQEPPDMMTATNQSKVSSRLNQNPNTNQNEEDDDSVDELDDDNNNNTGSSNDEADDNVDNVNVTVDTNANDNTIDGRRRNSNEATTQRSTSQHRQHLNSSKNELIDHQHQLCNVNRVHHANTKRQLIRGAAIVTGGAPTTTAATTATTRSGQQVRLTTTSNNNSKSKTSQTNKNIIRMKQQPHKHYMLDNNNKLFAASHNNNRQWYSQNHNASHHKGFNARFASQLYLLLHVSITLSLIYYSDLNSNLTNYLGKCRSSAATSSVVASSLALPSDLSLDFSSHLLSLDLSSHLLPDLSSHLSSSRPAPNEKTLLKEGKYEIVLASAGSGHQPHPARDTPNYLPSPSLLVAGGRFAAASQIMSPPPPPPQTTSIKLDNTMETLSKRPAISSVIKSAIPIYPDNNNGNNNSQDQLAKSRKDRSIVTTAGGHMPSNRFETEASGELVQLFNNPLYSKNLIHYYISYLLCTSSLLLILYRFCVAGKSKFRSSKLHKQLSDSGSSRRRAAKLHETKTAKPDNLLGPGDSRSCHRCQSKLDYAPVLLGSVTLGLIQLTVIGLEIAKFINDKHVYLPILKFVFVFFIMQFILARVSNTSKSDNLANFALAHLLATQVSLWLMKLNHVNDHYQQAAGQWHASFLDGDLLIKINNSTTLNDHSSHHHHQLQQPVVVVGQNQPTVHNLQQQQNGSYFSIRPAIAATTSATITTESPSKDDNDNERIVLQNNSGKTPIYMTSTSTKQQVQQPEQAANKLLLLQQVAASGDKLAKQYLQSRPMEQLKSNQQQQQHNIVGDIIISGTNQSDANKTNGNLLNLDVTSMIMDKILKGTNQLSLLRVEPPVASNAAQLPARQLIESSNGSNGLEAGKSSSGKSGDQQQLAGNNNNNNSQNSAASRNANSDGNSASLGAPVNANGSSSQQSIVTTTRRPETTQSPVRMTDVDTHTTTAATSSKQQTIDKQQHDNRLPKPSPSSMLPRQQQQPLPKPVITTTSLDENNRIINVTVRNQQQPQQQQQQLAANRDIGTKLGGNYNNQDNKRKTRERSANPITINRHTILVPDNSQIVAKKGPALKAASQQPPEKLQRHRADRGPQRRLPAGAPGVLAPGDRGNRGNRGNSSDSFGVPTGNRQQAKSSAPKKLESPYLLNSTNPNQTYKRHSAISSGNQVGNKHHQSRTKASQTADNSSTDNADHVSESPASFSADMEGDGPSRDNNEKHDNYDNYDNHDNHDNYDNHENHENSESELDPRLHSATPTGASLFSSELDIPDESFMFNEASTLRETVAVAPYSLQLPRQFIGEKFKLPPNANVSTIAKTITSNQWTALPKAAMLSLVGPSRARRHEQQQKQQEVPLFRASTPASNISANSNTFADLLMPFVHHYHILIIAILFNLWINQQSLTARQQTTTNNSSVTHKSTAPSSLKSHCLSGSSKVRLYHNHAIDSSSSDRKTILRSPSTDSSAISSSFLVELEEEKHKQKYQKRKQQLDAKIRSQSLESLNSSAFYDVENTAEHTTNWDKDPVKLNREGKIKQRHSTKRPTTTASGKKNHCHFLGARSSSMSLLSATSSTQPMTDTLRLDLLQSPAYVVSGSLSGSRQASSKSKSIKGFFVGMLVLSSSFIVLLLKNEIVTMTTHSAIQFISVIITIIALVMHWRKNRARRRKVNLYLQKQQQQQPMRSRFDMEAASCSPGQIMQIVDHHNTDRTIVNGNYFYRQPYSLMREQLKERQSSTIRAFMNSHLAMEQQQQQQQQRRGKQSKKNDSSLSSNNPATSQSNIVSECQLSIDFMSYLFLLSSYYCGLSVSLESYYKLTRLLVTNGSNDGWHTSVSIMLINSAFIHIIMIFKGVMLIVQVTLQSLLIRISCINSIETKQIFAFLIFTNLSLWILEVSDQGVPWASYDSASAIGATAAADRGLKHAMYNPRNIFSMLVTLTRFYQALVFMQHWMKTR